MSETSIRSLQTADFRRLDWRCIGPALMSGRVSCLAFEPGNSRCFYAGFATGGLWRTENRGVTFEPLFDDQETSCIGSIAVADAPADWDGWTAEEKKKSKKDREKLGRGRILWLGTGEGNGRNSSSWGCGVFRSADRGKTWTNVGLGESHDIPSLAVDPRNPDVCYAACLGRLWGLNTERGVYKTEDGGKTWSPVLQFDDRTGCVQVQVDPKNPDTVYAAMYFRRRFPWGFESGSSEGGLYKSTDAGKTWTKLTNGLPTVTGRIGFDIFAADPKVLIACVQSDENGTSSIRDDRSRAGGVFRSEDGGETWTRLSVRTPRAFYFSTIKFDPKDSQRIYQLGWHVEVSDDGGQTFRTGFGPKMHVDMHAFLVDPDDTDLVINGSDGGIYQSFDRGKTWQFLNTMAVGQFYNVAFDRSEPYRVMGGLQDNGTWIGPSSSRRRADKEEGDDTRTGITNADWQHVLWGDGFHADFDPTDPDVVYGEWQGGNLVRVNLRTAEKRKIAPEPAEGQARFRFNWNAPFFVSAHEPTTLYLAGNHVFRLKDRGEAWEKISPDLTRAEVDKIQTTGSAAETYGTVVTLAESPLDAGVLWAGSDDGLIHVTRDGGSTWANVTPESLVGGRYISRIDAGKASAGRAVVSVDGHRTDDMDPCILLTDDFGETWHDVTGDLPKGWSVKVVREDLDNPNLLYAGTENGVHASFDRGATWIRINGKALPTTPVDDIRQHPVTKDLILGTHGRSIWILDDASMLAPLAGPTDLGGAAFFPVLPARPHGFLTYGGLWTDQLFRAKNRPFGAVLNYWLPEWKDEPVKITIKNGAGLVVAELTGPNAPGLNRAVWDLQPKEEQQLPDGGQDLMFNPFLVASGDYTATLTWGDTKLDQPLT
ncbi:MAG: hypothetical protein MH204_01370, partial [Fimbriimonadaceae bacterium]|nr:hypothetical protein [Fimbriimonadaceae bacterium]